ncbi:hypothetical protein D3C81_1694710 [compost metagenome]
MARLLNSNSYSCSIRVLSPSRKKRRLSSSILPNITSEVAARRMRRRATRSALWPLKAERSISTKEACCTDTGQTSTG